MWRVRYGVYHVKSQVWCISCEESGVTYVLWRVRRDICHVKSQVWRFVICSGRHDAYCMKRRLYCRCHCLSPNILGTNENPNLSVAESTLEKDATEILEALNRYKLNWSQRPQNVRAILAFAFQLCFKITKRKMLNKSCGVADKAQLIDWKGG
jgi:hypothetical protein